MRKLSESISKEKFEASSLRINTEERLNNSQGHLTASLERNVELKRDVVCVKKELNEYLKWTASS